MEKLRENLIRYMNLKKWNAYHLQDHSGVPQPTTQRFLSGVQNNPRDSTVKKWAKALNVTEAELRGLVIDQTDKLINYQSGFASETNKVQEVQRAKKNFPRVVGTAKCGNHGYYMDLEGGDGYIEFEAEAGSIAIRIKGHSMHPAIREGWYVVIEPNKQPDIGEYVLIKFKDGRKMVKELIQIRPDSYLLLSVNDNERITAHFEELEGIQAITAIVPPSKHKEW